MIKAGIRVIAPCLLLLLSVTDAHALYSYSQVTTVLDELSASTASADGPRLQVVRIGTTVKGRPILMAVLSATPVTAPPMAGADEAPTDPGAVPEAPEASAGPEEGDTEENTPETGAPADRSALAVTPAAPSAVPGGARPAPVATSLTLTLEPDGREAPPVMAPPDEGSLADTLELKGNVEPRRVLVICRQHGNEPAGTEGAMQFLREYATTDDPRKLDILRKVTFLVVPMLNGDGAEMYQRRNARNVDLNRDWLAQSQPETQAIVRAVAAWRPDLVMDLHELATSDWTPSFVEAMEPEAGTSIAVGDACNAAIAAVVGPLRAQEMRIYARPVFNYREPRLAHRYFAVKRGVPTILVETRRAGDVALVHRATVHYASILAVARYMAGEQSGTPPRVIAAWLEPGNDSDYHAAVAKRSSTPLSTALAERRNPQLASRAARAKLAKQRARLAAKVKAAKAAKARKAKKRR